MTGASGFIGRHFCTLAVQRGHEVRGLVRPTSLGRIVGGVKPVIGSLPYDVPHHTLDSIDAVVHLAAITTADKAAQSYAVNQLGTEYLLHLAKGRCPRFLFLSTQSAHSGNKSAYATTKLASEEALRTAPDIQWVIVRPGLVYGPGETGLFARMRQTIRSLPLIPLLGGGKTLIQPVHVDDLSQALLTIIEDFDRFDKTQLEIGDPDGITLKELLSLVATAEGRPTRHLVVPTGPIKPIVAFGEKFGLPLPISSDNLKGLETVQRMDTGPSLNALSLKLRDLSVGLKDSLTPGPSSSDQRIPVALIGAGKIGIVHALQLRHSHRLQLSCIIEPNRKAHKLYRSIGFSAPFVENLQQALELGPSSPVAAIIATPADTHLSIARQCVARGLHILTEKPASISDTDAQAWRALHDEFPRQVIHCGYMAAQFPQLFSAFRLIRMNKLGPLKSARLVALQTHITAPRPVRWEMIREKSGGGAAINFGCHVASMLFRLAGWPDGDATGWQWPIHSTDVEDALTARFTIRGVPCSLAISWSVPGYARPFSLVELECEQGIIRVENASVTVIQDDNIQQFKTQLDYPLAFNMAPDYTGGGFALEHEAFAAAIQAAQAGRSWSSRQTDYMPAVELPEALRLENWIRMLYNKLPMQKPGHAEIMSLGISSEVAHALLCAGESQP